MNLARTLRLAVSFSLVVLSSASHATMFVFGDSLSDAGNVLQGSINAGKTPDPPVPPYWAGRMSNGPIWTDQLADMLGQQRPTASLNGGTNYAYAGAQLGAGQTLRTSIAVPGQTQLVDNVGKQIANFTASNPGGFKSDDLVLFWGGANDLLYGTLAVGQGLATADQVVGAMLNNTRLNLLALEAQGAARIVVPDQVDASRAPIWNGSYGLPAALQPVLSGLTGAFNQGLALLIAGVETLPGFDADIVFVPMSVHFQMLLNDPAAYGFTNITTPAYIPGVGQVSNASGKLFWDPIHPTTEGHTVLAAVARSAIPEPETAALVLAGLLLVRAFGGRRQPPE